ncbi:hypothetical protein U0355_13555 [Salimicrobium sp. PL1-032A]|uniref:hypothetical protein n=1 Tax=Salimicrobium sp. PL1-032A TaxID=3095364 RepID=UPI0032616EE2
MTRKQQFLLFITVVLLFFLASRFVLKEQEPTLTIDDEDSIISEEDLPRSWTVAETKEEVTAFFEEEIPQLKSARKQNLTNRYDRKLTFTDAPEKEMTILESWYNEHTIHLLYKTDIGHVKLDGKYRPRLLETAYIEKLDEGVEDQALRTLKPQRSAVVFDGDVYSYARLQAIQEEQELKTPGGNSLTSRIPADTFDETVRRRSAFISGKAPGNQVKPISTFPILRTPTKWIPMYSMKISMKGPGCATDPSALKMI